MSVVITITAHMMTAFPNTSADKSERERERERSNSPLTVCQRVSSGAPGAAITLFPNESHMNAVDARVGPAVACSRHYKKWLEFNKRTGKEHLGSTHPDTLQLFSTILTMTRERKNREGRPAGCTRLQ